MLELVNDRAPAKSTDVYFTYRRTEAESVTGEDIAGIYQTACEGGIGYWVEDVERFGPEVPGRFDDGSDILFARRPNGSSCYDGAYIARGGSLKIRSEDGVEWLTGEKLARAIVERANECGKSVRDYVDGCPDADEADIIVQNALFGDVIYG